jgi:SOS response regulatory protein OraA/RecX
VPTVTALRAAGRDRVAVELDGAPWRVLPTEVVLVAALARGIELDRPRARLVRRELRRADAHARAARRLRTRDRSIRELDERLADDGVAPAQRREALGTLARAGLLDDERLALSRAQTLAARGRGDAAIRHDLEARGIGGELVAGALAALPPERERAAELVARRGATPRTARALAAAGFGEDAVEAALPEDVAHGP